jgi:hypothetical protein
MVNGGEGTHGCCELAPHTRPRPTWNNRHPVRRVQFTAGVSAEVEGGRGPALPPSAPSGAVGTGLSSTTSKGVGSHFRSPCSAPSAATAAATSSVRSTSRRGRKSEERTPPPLPSSTTCRLGKKAKAPGDEGEGDKDGGEGQLQNPWYTKGNCVSNTEGVEWACGGWGRTRIEGGGGGKEQKGRGGGGGEWREERVTFKGSTHPHTPPRSGQCGGTRARSHCSGKHSTTDGGCSGRPLPGPGPACAPPHCTTSDWGHGRHPRRRWGRRHMPSSGRFPT